MAEIIKVADDKAAENKKTVLLAEDDIFLTQLLTTRLQRAGVNVIKAVDGEDILNILKTTTPDLILLDIILPKKSGFEVMEELRANPLLKTGPIIIISNLGQESDIARGKQLGAVEYFIKAQTSIDDLVVKIKEFLDKPVVKA
jgi:DNA-binding response OmpR family regulator